MTFLFLIITTAVALGASAQPGAPTAPAPAPAPAGAAPITPLGTQPDSPVPQPTPVVPAQSPARVANFDTDTPGTVPDGWKAEGTSQYGPLATWSVVADRSAPSQPNALALTKVNHTSDTTFNICWTDKVRFKEGWVEAKVRCDGGKNQRCAGLIWRVKDKDNYLLLRLSAMDQNLRLFYVRDGRRHELETQGSHFDGAAWHTLKIQQKGERILCFLDGTQLINLHDAHSQQWGSVGGIGVYTESDATAAFDDVRFQLTDPVAVVPSPGPELPVPDDKVDPRSLPPKP